MVKSAYPVAGVIDKNPSSAQAREHSPPAHYLASPLGCTTPAASVSPTSSCAAFICASTRRASHHALPQPKVHGVAIGLHGARSLRQPHLIHRRLYLCKYAARVMHALPQP